MPDTPYGVTVAPLMALGLPTALDVARQAEQLGYRSFWTAEVTGPEAMATLGAVSQAAPSLDLGTGVLALQLRTPPLLAMAGAAPPAPGPGPGILPGGGIS